MTYSISLIKYTYKTCEWGKIIAPGFVLNFCNKYFVWLRNKDLRDRDSLFGHKIPLFRLTKSKTKLAWV